MQFPNARPELILQACGPSKSAALTSWAALPCKNHGMAVFNVRHSRPADAMWPAEVTGHPTDGVTGT